MRQKISVLWVLICVAGLMAAAHARLGAQNQVRPRRAATVDTSPTLPAEIQAELVKYPSPEIAFICGSQLKAHSRLNPFSWFDETQIAQGRIQAREAPMTAPRA